VFFAVGISAVDNQRELSGEPRRWKTGFRFRRLTPRSSLRRWVLQRCNLVFHNVRDVKDKSDVPEFLILARDGTLSLQTVMAHLKSLADYGNLFEYAETVEGRTKVITLAHELGPKGPYFWHITSRLCSRVLMQARLSLLETTL
jgi:hypothetical protein